MNTQLTPGLPLGSGNSIYGLAGTGAVITFSLLGSTVDAGGLVTPQTLNQGQLAATNTLVYGVPSGVWAIVTAIFLTNTSSSPVTGIALALNGSAATAGNQLISSITIPANGLATLIDGKLTVYDSGGNIYQTSTSTSFDATLPAVTVPATLTGIAGTAATAARRDHQHQSPGGIASIIAASAGLNTVETRVVGATAPIGLFKAGTVLAIIAYGTLTSTVDNVCTFNLRIGPTTLTGVIPATLAAHPGNSGTTTTAPFVLTAWITIRTVGASGTAYGFGEVVSRPTGAAVTQALAEANALFTPANVTVDTTAANEVELTFVSAGTTSTATFQGAVITVVKM